MPNLHQCSPKVTNTCCFAHHREWVFAPDPELGPVFTPDCGKELGAEGVSIGCCREHRDYFFAITRQESDSD